MIEILGVWGWREAFPEGQVLPPECLIDWFNPDKRWSQGGSFPQGFLPLLQTTSETSEFLFLLVFSHNLKFSVPLSSHTLHLFLVQSSGRLEQLGTRANPSLIFGWGTPASLEQTLDCSWRLVLSRVLFTFGKSRASSIL